MGFWRKLGGAVFGGGSSTKAGGAIVGGAAGGSTVTGTVDAGGDAIGDALETGANAAADGASSAWDVLSGERDWRRQRDLQYETWKREDEAHRREMADLAAAGLNPINATQGSGSPTSNSSAQSHTAQGVSGAINSGISMLSSIGNVKNLLAAANKTRAETDYIRASTPFKVESDRLHPKLVGAQTATELARPANIKADTRHKGALTALDVIRGQQERMRLPEFAAREKLWREHGHGAALADLIRNPQQMVMYGVGEAGAAIDRNLSTAGDVLSSRVGSGVQALGRKTKQYNRLQNSYYNRR